MTGIHACHSVCILMYKQMYTYICISYNIWKWIGNNHILYNTLSSSNLQRALWVRFLSCLGAQIYIQLAVWDQTVNVTLKAVAELHITTAFLHYLDTSLGYLLRGGQHKHPMLSGWGTARENKHTRTGTCFNSRCTHLIRWMGRPKIQNKNKNKTRKFNKQRN